MHISFLTLLNEYSYSQRRVVRVVVKRTWYWTLGIDGGLTMPIGDLRTAYKTSGNAGLELAYHPGPNFAFFFNTQYNFLSTKDPSISVTPSYIELGVGGRLYLGKDPVNFLSKANLVIIFIIIALSILIMDTTQHIHRGILA